MTPKSDILVTNLLETCRGDWETFDQPRLGPGDALLKVIGLRKLTPVGIGLESLDKKILKPVEGILPAALILINLNVFFYSKTVCCRLIYHRCPVQIYQGF